MQKDHNEGKCRLNSIFVSFAFEGSVNMIISSNNRSSIAYNGEIYSAEVPKEKK
jgi:hypothetical protein